MTPAPRCEVCGGPFSVRTRSRATVCGLCRQGGARFLRAWIADLRKAGTGYGLVAHLTGVSIEAARARHSEHRRST